MQGQADAQPSALFQGWARPPIYKDTYKETHQDTYNHTYKDTYRTYKDTCKDTYKDTCKDTYKDTCKDTYKDTYKDKQIGHHVVFFQEDHVPILHFGLW